MKPIPEEWARTIDCLTKLLTAVVIVFGGWWTVYQYLNGRTNQLATQRLEAQKPLLEERLRLYVEATTAAATIATSQDASEVANAKERFWRLYRGPMNLVQDYRVWQSMSEFGACLQNSKCQSSLAELSENLARNCGNSLHTGFILASPGSLKAVVQ